MPRKKVIREGDGAQPQFCGLTANRLDLPLGLAKQLIPMTLDSYLHLSGPQCPHLYNGDKKTLAKLMPGFHSAQSRKAITVFLISGSRPSPPRLELLLQQVALSPGRGARSWGARANRPYCGGQT